jgi:hypothetical protein
MSKQLSDVLPLNENIPECSKPRITTSVFLFKVGKILRALNAVVKSETKSNCVAQNSIYGIQRCDMISCQKVCGKLWQMFPWPVHVLGKMGYCSIDTWLVLGRLT